jgi:SWI/SNF-related matrix-associated actin-dependent regulator 1 of chromatin subfamily A
MDIQQTALPLMPHQIEATRFAIDRQRVLLAMEMGTGKSPTAVSIALSSVTAGLRPVLVICPPSMRLQFDREFERFAPQLTRATLHGRKPEKDSTLPDVDVLIIGDISLDGFKFQLTGKIAGIICDECHRLKGGKRAKRSMAFRQIARSVPLSGVRVAMSGTPLINRPAELVTLIEALEQASVFTGGIDGFMARYAPRIDTYGSRGTAKLSELHDVLVNSFMFRKTRDEVMTLPNKGRINMHVELDSVNERKYRFAESDLYNFIRLHKGQKFANNIERAEALVKINTLRHVSAIGKVQSITTYVRELLEQDEQVFITCAFKDEAKMYFEAFKDSHSASRVVGNMSDAEKMSAVDRFQSGESRVLIGNIVAAGTGLTLTSGRHHIAASLDWSSASLLQCEDRLQRFGQTRDVVSHVMISDIEGIDSIDSRMLQIVEHKNRILTAVLDGKPIDLIDDDNRNTAMIVLNSYGWSF